ncbi:hypothetical protein AMTR_s00100p00110580 [Amborella trichopoda]|uniref:Uncharacterized protein n=1 Tax=Amborella trichopoda TaxID=13333 RepID=W1NT44_AMBTC|nr:hypothetical protein AMTR_s00100p00110580 [Amborella trichopoda]
MSPEGVPHRNAFIYCQSAKHSARAKYLQKMYPVRARSYTVEALNTLPERAITLLERCGSKAYIAGAFFGTTGAHRQNLYYQSASLYCRSALGKLKNGKQERASEHVHILPERPITLPERCGSKAYIVGAFFGTAGARLCTAAAHWVN